MYNNVIVLLSITLMDVMSTTEGHAVPDRYLLVFAKEVDEARKPSSDHKM